MCLIQVDLLLRYRRRTAKGEQFPVTLADGSRVELNTDTELRVHLSYRERRVDLLRGEAFFTVQHDAARPFEITTAGGRIRDLGTRFDVYATPHQVTVDEGKVEVTTRPAHTATLSAGKQIAYTPEGALSPVTQAGRNATAWRDGHLAFDLTPLAEVMAQIERYHPVKIVIADPSLQALRVTGRFQFRDLLLLLRTLEATFPLKAEPAKDGQIRLSRVTN
ncbi:MAG: FecR family protein [Gammaproteobacteria bacterium]